MNIEACFPTLNRQDWARDLILAIGSRCPVRVSWETEPHALTGLVNRLFSESYDSGFDVTVMLADHLAPQPGYFDVIESSFAELFPDTDGVVGTNIANIDLCPGYGEYAFMAVGRRFLERFPKRIVFCPDYYHFFGDTELGEYASSLGKFHFEPAAAVHTRLHDRGLQIAKQEPTHQKSRAHLRFDQNTRAKRKRAGFTWGNTFSRIHNDDSETAARNWTGEDSASK